MSLPTNFFIGRGGVKQHYRAPTTLSLSQANSIQALVPGDIIDIAYTGSSQTFNSRNAKSIEIRLIGANGRDGDNSNRAGGGGTVQGDYLVPYNTSYFVYVGGYGSYGTAGNRRSGGFNGGGSIHDSGNPGWYVAGAGGATDFRTIGGGSWEDITSLNSRILVAGGGGAGSRNGGSGSGGVGAYPTGGDGMDGGGGAGGGYGGTQTAGGAGGGNCSNNCGSAYSWAGTFGEGGHIPPYGQSTNLNHLGGAGGGGWYGGGTGANHMGTGGGGSSYYDTGVITNFTHSDGLQYQGHANGSARIVILDAKP